MVPLVGSRDPEISPSRVDFPMPAERSNIALDITTQKLQNDVPLVPMLQSQHDQFLTAANEIDYSRFDILIAAGWCKLQENYKSIYSG